MKNRKREQDITRSTFYICLKNPLKDKNIVYNSYGVKKIKINTQRGI